MRALILGCGPAGLMAAHAAVQMGHDVLIYSKPRKSRLYGCQYLHAPIPGATTGEPVEVEYRLEGTAEEYREKVYGSRTVKTSPETLDDNHHAWDIRQTYDALWEMYGGFVQPVDFTSFPGDNGHQVAADLIHDLDPDLTISTIPAPLLCNGSHDFTSETVFAMGDAPEEGQRVPFRAPENTIICDGTRGRGWYRASNVFGFGTVEWPGHRKPPITGVVPVEKPIATNCTCLPEILRSGRFGRWTKGVLSHESYYDTISVIQRLDGMGIQEPLW